MKHSFLYSLLFVLMVPSLALAQQIVDYVPTLADSVQVFEFLSNDIISSSEKALNLSEEIDFTRGRNQALKQLSLLHEREGNTALALRYALERVDLLKEEGIIAEAFEANLRVGDIYFREELYDYALIYYLQGERQKAPKETDQVLLWERIGEAYQGDFNADSAVIFFNKALTHFTVENNYDGQLKNLQAIVHIYEGEQKCQEALRLNSKIQELIEKEGDGPKKATAYNNIGYNYHCLNDFENAIINFNEAAAYCNANCELDEILLNANLGVAYSNNGNMSKAIEHLDIGIKKARDDKNFRERARLLHIKAYIYYQNRDLYQAQTFNSESMRLAEKREFPKILVDTYELAALINQDLYEFETALDFYQKHLTMRDSIALEERLRQQALLQQQAMLERSEKEVKLLLVNQKVQDLAIKQLNLENDKMKLETDNMMLESKRKEDELALLKSEQAIKEERLKIQELEAARTKAQLELTRQQLETAEKDRSIAELQKNEEIQKAALVQKEAEEQQRKQEIENLNKQRTIDELELGKQRDFLQFATGLGIALLAILGLSLFSFWNAKRNNKILAKQNKEIEESKTIIEQEREKSENLLLNVLPVETAKELKETGAATTRHYKKATVLFTDFVGFTKLSESMKPEEIIEELNECFLAFDEIIEQHNLEKIKTIGDSYMCAGGLPLENETNPQDAVAAALKMRDYLLNRRASKLAQGKPYWEMRIGIHTGELVAGVVGSKKFAYDIWGDTVNTASRLEAGGEGGKVNISEATYEYIKDQYDCTYRGRYEVKNKEVAMYFVD